MVYHLKEWAFLRDAMLFGPEVVENMIVEALEISGFPIKSLDIIHELIDACKFVNTRDGLEAGIMMFREDISIGFRIPGESDAFETFLEVLDGLTAEFRYNWAERHYL